MHRIDILLAGIKRDMKIQTVYLEGCLRILIKRKRKRRPLHALK